MCSRKKHSCNLTLASGPELAPGAAVSDAFAPVAYVLLSLALDAVNLRANFFFVTSRVSQYSMAASFWVAKLVPEPFLRDRFHVFPTPTSSPGPRTKHHLSQNDRRGRAGPSSCEE